MRRHDRENQGLAARRLRPVVVVSGADYDEARRQVEELRLFIRQLALVSPRGETWERTYQALQERARRLLADLADRQTLHAKAA